MLLFNNNQDDDDDEETARFSILQLQGSDTDEEDADEPPEILAEEDDHQHQEDKLHYLQSIDSSVVVRVLPSQGLSFQLWPAASTLVTLLDQHNSIHNNPLSAILHRKNPLRILELGSGTGLVGIAAAAILGSTVTITDLPHVLPNLQFNATANSSTLALHGGSVDVASLRWGEAEDMESIGREFDVVLGTDVVYHAHLFDPLLQTLKFFLGGDSKIVFLMAHLRRWKKDSVFFKRARKMFDVETLHTDAPCQGSRTGVVVYSFTGKKGLNPLSSIADS